MLNQENKNNVQMKAVSSFYKNWLKITNVHDDVKMNDITSVFSPFGEILDCFIDTDENTVYIKMENHADVKYGMDGSMLKNKQISITFYPNACSLKVRCLDHDVSDEDLKNAFQPFGDVLYAKVFCNEQSVSKEKGEVGFAKVQSAISAYKHCSNNNLLIRGFQPAIVEKMATDKYNIYVGNSVSDTKATPRLVEKNTIEDKIAKGFRDIYNATKAEVQCVINNENFKKITLINHASLLKNIDQHVNKTLETLQTNKAESNKPAECPPICWCLFCIGKKWELAKIAGNTEKEKKKPDDQKSITIEEHQSTESPLQPKRVVLFTGNLNEQNCQFIVSHVQEPGQPQEEKNVGLELETHEENIDGELAPEKKKK